MPMLTQLLGWERRWDKIVLFSPPWYLRLLLIKTEPTEYERTKIVEEVLTHAFCHLVACRGPDVVGSCPSGGAEATPTSWRRERTGYADRHPAADGNAHPTTGGSASDPATAYTRQCAAATVGLAVVSESAAAGAATSSGSAITPKAADTSGSGNLVPAGWVQCVAIQPAGGKWNQPP